ncbi:hypothetical protein PR048_008541 [Dryococelus australis]|uniref:Uncharacterized protein n=1 Tax=Dryococelus australis TaxID=614101 RepID=A0ABQ9HXD7_9NEOP|nr:hypothetical protein PR048_008541 [Dryococelus australis]
MPTKFREKRVLTQINKMDTASHQDESIALILCKMCLAHKLVQEIFVQGRHLEQVWLSSRIVRNLLKSGMDPRIGGETGNLRENPLTNGIVRHDSHMRKSGVTRPGIEPGSPWWEASRLTAQRPWPQNTAQRRISQLLDSISVKLLQPLSPTSCFSFCFMGRGGKVARLLTSDLDAPGSIPGGVAPGFLHAGIVPNDAAGRRVFSGISLFPRPFIPALLHTHLASPSSALKTSILRAVQISPTPLHSPVFPPKKAKDASSLYSISWSAKRQHTELDVVMYEGCRLEKSTTVFLKMGRGYRETYAHYSPLCVPPPVVWRKKCLEEKIACDWTKGVQDDRQALSKVPLMSNTLAVVETPYTRGNLKRHPSQMKGQHTEWQHSPGSVLYRREKRICFCKRDYLGNLVDFEEKKDILSEKLEKYGGRVTSQHGARWFRLRRQTPLCTRKDESPTRVKIYKETPSSKNPSKPRTESKALYRRASFVNKKVITLLFSNPMYTPYTK